MRSRVKGKQRNDKTAFQLMVTNMWPASRMARQKINNCHKNYPIIIRTNKLVKFVKGEVVPVLYF
jgi:hypothetical protein